MALLSNAFWTCVFKEKADVGSIYLALDVSKKISSGWQIVKMDIDDAATFSAKKTGVQARLEKNAPHAVFVHCH